MTLRELFYITAGIFLGVLVEELSAHYKLTQVEVDLLFQRLRSQSRKSIRR